MLAVFSFCTGIVLPAFVGLLALRLVQLRGDPGISSAGLWALVAAMTAGTSAISGDWASTAGNVVSAGMALAFWWPRPGRMQG